MRQKKDSSRIHKVISDYGIEDYYKNFHKTYKNTKHDIDYKTYSTVLDDILIGVANAIIYKMYDLKLPHNLGRIITRKYKPKMYYKDNGEAFVKRPIDWKSTKKMWEQYPEAAERKQLVYYLNDHSNGYVFTFIYRKRGCAFHNKLYYAVQVNRRIKRSVKDQIKLGEFDSLETNMK